MNEGAFFQDLAMLMTVAGIVAVVFSRFGWPKVIGYILAGILMNEYTWGGSFLADAGTVKTLGQLGIVFLMFGMGLSFSARDLKKIRTVAMPAALVDTVMMTWLGYTLGTRIFGWSTVPSLFLGVAICDSATTLLAKVLVEMGWGQRMFAKCALGTSVCEDIICVGAITVVTGFARGGGMSAKAFASSLGWLAVFSLAVLVFGLILVPRLLVSVNKRRDEEALVLTLLGLCFCVSYFAEHFNFSLALGAFIVGLVGSTSDIRERIGALFDPLKSMFAAVFFVSIGLLVDPVALFRYAPQILLVSAVIMVGKTLNVSFASMAAGTDVKTAVQNGMSLAQTGEFAFMVAIIYASVGKDQSCPMFPIAVGSSLLTTIANPWMIRLSDRVGDQVEQRIPSRIRSWFETYRAWIVKISSSSGSPAFVLFKAAAMRLGVYAVLMVAIAATATLLPGFDFSRFSVFFERHDKVIFFYLANVFSLSMLTLVVPAALALGDEVTELLCGGNMDRWQVQARLFIRFVVLAAVIGLFFVEWTMINLTIAPDGGWTPWIGILAIIVTAVAGWKFLLATGRKAIKRLHEALSAEERREGLVRTMTISVPEGTIHRFMLEASSPAIGSTIASLNIRAKTGATVVSVYRHGVINRNVAPDWEFQVGDTLVVIGDQRQVAALKDLVGISEAVAS